MLVILDPGHAAGVAGKRSPDGRLREYKWAREITGMLEKELDALQIQHVRSTPPSEDEGKEPGLTLRCQRANKAAKSHEGKSIFISIHINAAGSAGKWMTARGWSVFVGTSASSNSKKLASYMTAKARETGVKVRVPDPQHEYWTANFTVLNKTSMPAVLVENFFQDNLEDVEFLLSDAGKKTVVNIILGGIKNYFGL